MIIMYVKKLVFMNKKWLISEHDRKKEGEED
jgi:hypothetical protein